jgi:hypothetical protein
VLALARTIAGIFRTFVTVVGAGNAAGCEQIGGTGGRQSIAKFRLIALADGPAAQRSALGKIGGTTTGAIATIGCIAKPLRL